MFNGFISVLDEVILPSISLLSCNCGMAEEVWAMIKFLPYERRFGALLISAHQEYCFLIFRYQLYGHWKNESYDLHPIMIDKKSEILSRGRYIMK